MATTQSDTLGLTIQDDSENFEIETTARNFGLIDTFAAGIDAGLAGAETPDVTPPQTLTQPESGEKRISIFGKMAAFVRDLIAHIGPGGAHPNATQSAAGLMSAADKTKLDGIDWGANNFSYTHPGHTAAGLGFYKLTVDAQGHVTAATAVKKSDLSSLLPAKPTYPSGAQKFSGSTTVTLAAYSTIGSTRINLTQTKGITSDSGIYAAATFRSLPSGAGENNWMKGVATRVYTSDGSVWLEISVYHENYSPQVSVDVAWALLNKT